MATNYYTGVTTFDDVLGSFDWSTGKGTGLLSGFDTSDLWGTPKTTSSKHLLSPVASIAARAAGGAGANPAATKGGKLPFVSGACCFLTARALEQIKVDLAYSRANVKICGMSAGLAYGPLGAKHHSIEDVARPRVIADLCVIVPADPLETEQAVRAIAVYEGPVYLRLSRMPVPAAHPPQYRFEIGRAAVLRDGTDLTLISNGTMVSRAMGAAEALSKEGVEVRVVNMSTIKPLDAATIESDARETGAIITVEEHSVFGGLGGAVAEVVVRRDDHAVRSATATSSRKHWQTGRSWMAWGFCTGGRQTRSTRSSPRRWRWTRRRRWRSATGSGAIGRMIVRTSGWSTGIAFRSGATS